MNVAPEIWFIQINGDVDNTRVCVCVYIYIYCILFDLGLEIVEITYNNN
jgi:hypothetical protein